MSTSPKVPSTKPMDGQEKTRVRDLSPDKRSKQQVDDEFTRLLKKAPRDPSPEKKDKQLTLITDEEVSTVFKTLITYTLLIIFMPIVTYFGVKTYVFEDMLGYSSAQSFIYWAVLAVASIHVVLFVLVFKAFTEGTKPRTLKQD